MVASFAPTRKSCVVGVNLLAHKTAPCRLFALVFTLAAGKHQNIVGTLVCDFAVALTKHSGVVQKAQLRSTLCAIFKRKGGAWQW